MFCGRPPAVTFRVPAAFLRFLERRLEAWHQAFGTRLPGAPVAHAEVDHAQIKLTLVAARLVVDEKVITFPAAVLGEICAGICVCVVCVYSFING